VSGEQQRDSSLSEAHMNAHDHPDGAAVDAGRRVFVSAVVGGYVASLIPWALAQSSADAQRGTFIAVSAILVGQPSLDAAQGERLYTALLADDAGFASAAAALLAFIESRKIDPLQLQAMLDAEKSPLANVPRQISSAWWLGIVGTADKARCVAFETALNAQAVADVIKPPTYAYGPYGSWTRKPV
jgi:hypothetical protein